MRLTVTEKYEQLQITKKGKFNPSSEVTFQKKNYKLLSEFERKYRHRQSIIR